MSETADILSMMAALGHDPFGTRGQRRPYKAYKEPPLKKKVVNVTCLICKNTFKSKQDYNTCDKCGHHGKIFTDGDKTRF